jgi:pimeloyl-ACP methyl ester carboxylesterase
MSNEGQFDVESADGTKVAVWVEGSGPPLVLVHGALSDHTTFALLIAELRDRMTTFAMDRRGRAPAATAPANIPLSVNSRMSPRSSTR